MKTKYILGLILMLVATDVLMAQANLIASYNFNGGSAIDNSGNGHTGTFFGSSSAGDTLNVGYNTADYFTVPASVLNSRVQFSAEFKVKFTAFNTAGAYPTNTIFSADNSSTSGVFALSYQKDVNKWRVGNNVTAFDFADNSIIAGKWYCVTLTRDNSGNMKLYVDGAQNSAVNVYTAPINVTSFIIGQETDCFSGCFAANQCGYAKYDDVRFYDNALTATEINSNCATLISVKEYGEFQMSVYPNPTNGTVLRIKNINGIHNFSLSISSPDGRHLQNTDYKNETDIDLDIEYLKPGIYFLTISCDGKTSTMKFIKM